MKEIKKNDLALPLIGLGMGLLAGFVVGFILSAPDRDSHPPAAPGQKG